MSKLKRWWNRWEWPVMALLAVSALALGYFGYRRHFGDARPWYELLYFSLQLFVLESAADSSRWVPPLLHVARFLAPGVAVYTAVQAFALIFRDQWQRVRLFWWRDHVIVCGLGTQGSLLVSNLRRAGVRVAALERNPDPGRAAAARERGALVFAGDATDGFTLARLRLKKARYLVALCGGDAVNAEVALRTREQSRGRRPPLTCFVHMVDPNLCRLLRERQLSDLDESFRLEFFSIFESGAREVWRDLPAARINHLVLIGLGRMGEALLAHAARARPSAAGRLTVTVVDRAATQRVASLTLRYPRILDVCDLAAADMEVESPQFERGEVLRRRPPAVDAVCICLNDDARGLAAALAIARHLVAADVPIVVRVREHAGLTALVERQAAEIRLHVFGLLDRALDTKLFDNGLIETLAHAIHDEYVERTPSARPWAELPEDQREWNRRQAEDLSRKLRAIDCAVAPLADLNEDLVELSDEELERLAKMEHARWLAERRADGWTYAPGSKNPERKTHPLLVPWEALPAEGQEMNRQNARRLPAFVAKVGFGIVRRAATSSGVRARL